MRRRRRNATRIFPPAALAVAVVSAAVLVWHASTAAFTATTTNPGNQWTTGSVDISNDQSVTAVFTVPVAKPDTATSVLAPPGTGAFTASSIASGGSACIKVTYLGSMTADVRVHVALNNTGADGGLGQFLLFDVDTGTDPAGGTDLTCSTYTSSTYVYGSATNSTNFLNGMPGNYTSAPAAWTGVAQNNTRWYRLSWLLPMNVANTAQSEQVQATVTWEARNS